MRYSALIAACAAGIYIVASGAPVQAQTASPQANTAAKQPLWLVRCTTTSREAPPDCSIEQRAVMTETGQLLTQVTIRVPAKTRKPVLMIQAPLGPFLPGGISLDIDGASPLKLDFQTCDAKGCYAGSPVSDELLQALFRGQKLNVTIQALNKQPVKVPMELTGFTSAFRNIQ